MGVGSSKGRKQKAYPLATPYFPPGYVPSGGQGFVPASGQLFMAPPPMWAQQPQEPRRKSRRRKAASSAAAFPAGFEPSRTASAQGASYYQPGASMPQPVFGGPVIPPPPIIASSTPAGPMFPSPITQQPRTENGTNRRAQTPYVSTAALDSRTSSERQHGRRSEAGHSQSRQHHRRHNTWQPGTAQSQQQSSGTEPWRMPEPYIPRFSDAQQEQRREEGEGSFDDQQQRQQQQQNDDIPQQPNLAHSLRPMEAAPPGAYGPQSNRRPSLRNPLPPPPRDLYEMTPYKTVVNLPQTTALLTASYANDLHRANTTSGATSHGHSNNHDNNSNSTKDKKTPQRKGLFRSFSSARKKDKEPEQEQEQQERRPTEPNVRFVPIFIPTPAQNVSGGSGTGGGSSNTGASVEGGGTRGVGSSAFHPNQQSLSPVPPSTSSASAASSPLTPIRFDQQSAYSGFMNHSPHRVIYNNLVYPTATHLHEAMKYFEGPRPDIAEKIRNCPEIKDVYPLSAKYQKYQRSDWAQVFLKVMEDVLLIKFRQQPDLRSLLASTGQSPIVYVDPNDDYWGDGPRGDGQNQLGKALVRVRDRMRAEQYI